MHLIAMIITIITNIQTQLTVKPFTDTAHTVRGAGSMKRSSVRPYVCPSSSSSGGFAAECPMDRRY